MPQIKTQSLLAVVEGNKGNNKVFCKRFVNTTRNDSKDTIIDNFLSSGIEVARDTLTGISRKNGNFNPSFLGFRKIISSGEEGGEICYSSVNVIQMKRGASDLRSRELTYVFIEWGQSGGWKFYGSRNSGSRVVRSW